MPLLPSVYEHDEPLNDWMRYVAPIAAVVLVVLVVALQQFNVALNGSTLTKPLDSQTGNEEASAPEIDPFTLQSKALVKSAAFQLAETPDAKDKRIEEIDEDFKEVVAELEKAAISRTERLRLALVLAEIRGPAEGVKRLRELRSEATPDGDLYRDADWLLRWYASLEAGKPQDLPPEVQTSLRGRHGWFADLAFTYGKFPSHPARREAAGGIEELGIVMLAFGTMYLLMFLAGLVCLIVLLARAGAGGLTDNSTQSDAPDHVYLETFCLFGVLFTVFLCARVLFLGQRETWSFVVSETLIWSGSISAVWPMLRGVSWDEWVTDIGLKVEGSYAKEIMIGVIVFLVERPVYVFFQLIASLVFTDQAAPDGYPTFDQAPLAGTWVAFFFGVLGAVVWAPITEEIMFRGCLYRYLDGRVPAIARILITAFAFAIYHPYDIEGIISVGIGGLFFGFLREWRGTIIAAITAHFLHNALISVQELSMLAAIS